MTKRQLLLIPYLLIVLVITACSTEPSPATATPDEVSLQPSDAPRAAANPPTATATGLPPLPPSVSQTPLAPTGTPTLTPSPTDTPTAAATPTVPASVIEVEGAALPPGFSMITFASLVQPTALTTDPEGRILVTSQDGTIHLFEDVDGDGRADSDSIFSFGFNIPLGITVAPDGETVFVSSNGKISTLRDSDGDGVADEVANFASGLPVGRHQNDNLKFGPDGLLYIGVGSTCDVCDESDSRSATIMRFDPETGAGEVFASGLRNPYDLAFHPLTGELFATDNGRDDLGMDAPGEELNLILQGADYGWPQCWDQGVGSGCDGTQTAVAFFEPHSSANSLDFYHEDQFPPEYRTDADSAVAYIGIFGSWLKPTVKTGIVRVRLDRNGESYSSEVSWFAQWPGAMPLGLIVGEDGALYVGDYISGRIYRISYGP